MALSSQRLVLLSLLCALVSLKSYTFSNFNSNCLNCVNAGHDFCSTGTYGGPVDPISSVCCAGMTNFFDSC